MNKICVIGEGEFLEDVASVLSADNIAFTVRKVDLILNPLSVDEAVLEKKGSAIFLAIDNRFLNQNRQFNLKKALAEQAQIVSVVSSRSIIGHNAQIGRNVFVGDGVLLGRNCRVGNGAVILSGASVGSEVKIGSNAWIDEGVRIESKAQIGSNCVIGTQVAIGPVIVGSNCELTKPGIYSKNVDSRTHHIKFARSAIRTFAGKGF